MGLRRGFSDYGLFNVAGEKIEANSNDQPVAVSLGWDFTSEHEWGIKATHETFGIDYDNKIGIDRRVVGDFDKDALLLVESKEHVLLIGDAPYEGAARNNITSQSLDKLVKSNTYPLSEISIREKDTFAGGWGDGVFGILAKAKSPVGDFVKDLYAAFHKKDVAIYIGGRAAPFGNAGLVLAIVSRMPAEVLKDMRDVDQDTNKLKKAAEDIEKKTGFKEKIKESGQNWFALSPKWAKEIKSTKDSEIKTAYDVIYFLNPCNQDKNNFGWYTVENLLLWAEGKGPIPKNDLTPKKTPKRKK